MKINNLLLKKDVKLSEYIEDNVSVQNVTTFYQLAKLYNLKSFAVITLSYIERCFSMVVESQSFLEIEYNLVKKILQVLSEHSTQNY